MKGKSSPTFAVAEGEEMHVRTIVPNGKFAVHLTPFVNEY